MQEPNEEREWRIHCVRFGGTRNSLACAHYDRYRSCRKNCAELKKIVDEHEDFEDKVAALFKDRKTFLSSNYSCKGIPSSKEVPFKCHICGYVAKSERGLKSHKTRSHTKHNHTERSPCEHTDTQRR